MPQLLYLREIASDTNCIGDWVDLGASLDTKEKRKTFTCVKNETPVVLTVLTKLFWLLALVQTWNTSDPHHI
jgi:hypothetical protein